MLVRSVADNDYSQVVNEFRQFYQPDTLNQPTDPSLMRRDAREKLAGKIEITPTTSTNNDEYRQGLCADSQARFGRKAISFDLSFYDSAAYAQIIQNYFCDRFSSLHKRIAIRIPRRSYFSTLDFFSQLLTHHQGVSVTDGAAMPMRQQDEYTPTTTYYEGVPCLVWSGGAVLGEIYDIEENGAWMTVSIQTVSIF